MHSFRGDWALKRRCDTSALLRSGSGGMLIPSFESDTRVCPRDRRAHMMFWLFFLMAQAVAPTQIERGEALYMDANGCASCHQLKGKGTAAGPDLKLISSLAPKAIAMAIRSTVTQ